MKVLGLDISSVASGWAVKGDGGLEGWGSWVPQKGAQLHEKVGWVAEQFTILVKATQPDLIVIEDTYFSKNPETLKKLCYFIGGILGRGNGVEPILVKASKARKAFGVKGKGKGQGRADRKWIKEEVKKTIKWKLGIDVEDDNIADAIILSYYRGDKC